MDTEDWIVQWIKTGIVIAFVAMLIAVASTAFADPGHTHVYAPGSGPASAGQCQSFWSSIGAGAARFFLWCSFY